MLILQAGKLEIFGYAHNRRHAISAEQSRSLCLGRPPRWRCVTQQVLTSLRQNDRPVPAACVVRRFFDPSLEKDQLKVARQGGSVLVISTSNFGAARGPQPGDEYEQRELWGVNPEGTKLLTIDAGEHARNPARARQQARTAHFSDDVFTHAESLSALWMLHMQHASYDAYAAFYQPLLIKRIPPLQR
jgi:hypothetical protein